MRSIHHAMGALALVFFVSGQAMASPILPEGTSVTVVPTTLLGYDAGLNDYVAGGTSAVDDLNIEFLTDDFALAIDFGSDGLLRLWDNLGSGDDLFNDSFQFSFAGIGNLYDIRPRDLSGLAAGALFFSVIDDDTFELTLRDAQFAPGFSHVDLGISVDEPSTLALFAPAMLLGILGVRATRRRRSRLDRSAEVAS